MAALNEVPTPFLTFIPQSGTPALPPGGDQRLYLASVDGRLYSIDAAGLVRAAVAAEVWGPLSNGNPASPCILNSRGTIMVSRRS